MRPARIGSLELTALVAAIGATVVVLVLSARSAGVNQNLWRAYVLVLCFLAAVCMLRLLRHVGERGGEGGPRSAARAAAGLPEELTRVNDLLHAGIASRPDFEHGMRPVLREIAADRLLSKGIDLGREPERAGAELGPEASELLLGRSANRPGFQDRGPTGREISALLDRLEGIGR